MEQRHPCLAMLKFNLLAMPLCFLLSTATKGAPENDPWYGDFLGTLPDRQEIGIFGKVYLVNSTCLQILNFTYNGQAPDLFFWLDSVEPPSPRGVKVASFESGDKSLLPYYDKHVILTLPSNVAITDFSTFGLWCQSCSQDFGHVRLSLSHSPPTAQFLEGGLRATTKGMRYNVGSGPVLIMDRRTVKIYGLTFDGNRAPGKVPRTTFTFQLGPPGGARAYESLAKAKPGEFVWYVNGYMTPELWVQRGVTYTMRVEGGDDAILERLFNPLYISDDPYGGYAKLADEDKSQITVYAGLNKQSQPYDGTEAHGERSYGRLCRFINNKSTKDPDSMDSFQEFKQNLVLRCLRGNAGVFQWTPDERTPDVVYYQSYTNFNMGWKIVVTDEIPTDLPFTEEEPYSYELLDSVEEGMYKKTGGNKQDADGSSANVIHNSWLACFTLVLAIFLSNVRAY